ncbi:MAG: DUF4097 family beta strand repeat protein [Acidobacteria bacterium]|nr:DUF4097 family beta strand repeat protein [Acidobacteriota bacterium]
MRRGSVIGPLILILLGVLFLLNNLRPDLSLLDLVARYWPYLLIGWGVLRLIEVVYWAATSKPLPASGISGGEWTLVVFLVLIGSGLFFLHERSGWWSPLRMRIHGVEVFGETFDFPIAEQKLTAGKTPRILVENHRGNVRIAGADTEEVKVLGHKSVRALNQKDADEADRLTQLELKNQGDIIVIRTNHDRAGSETRIAADLEVTVPRGAMVDARGRYGDYDVTDLAGDVEIQSENAGVRIQNLGGNLRVDTRRGDVLRALNVKGTVELKGRNNNVELENIAGQVTINGAYYDLQFRNLAKPLRYNSDRTELRVEGIPGQLRMASGDVVGEELAGPVYLHSRSKDVQIAGVSNSLEVALDRGDIEVRPGLPTPKLDLRTRAGDIDLALAEKAQFKLRATTQRGEIENDFGAPVHVDSREHERAQTATGSVGEGAEVVLVTDRGRIQIRKAMGAEPLRNLESRPPLPAPPEPPEAPRRRLPAVTN